jgi:hypothetical protein
LAAVFYIGGRAGGAAKPWVWNRGDAEPVWKNHGFSAHLAITTSTVNSGASTTTSHADHARLDVASVVVRPDSEHPLAIICAERIAEQLKTIPAIQRSEFIPHGPLIRKDEMLPAWLVRVDVDNLNEWVIPNRSLSGNIRVALGATAAQSPCSYADNSALAQFEKSASNDVRFTCTGISTQSAFYIKIADEVAKKTVDSIKQDFDKLSESNPVLPKMPVQFYPPYREASEVPPIPGLITQTTLIDGRRFMQPHYSLMEIESNFNGTDNEFLTEIKQAMEADGWHGHIQKSGEQLSAYMYLTKGDETFYMFKRRKNDGVMITFPLPGGEPKTMAATMAVNEPPHVFLLERTEKMSNDALYPAIQTLLDENASAPTLLIFSNRLYDKNNATVKELREQIRQRLLEAKTGTPTEQLSLVRFFKEEGDKDIAKEMLFKAWRIRQLTPNPKPDSDYMKLAKELDVEEEMKAQPPLTAELCKEYGYIALKPENCPMEVNAELEKEVRFVISEDRRILLVRFNFRHENRIFYKEERTEFFDNNGTSRGSAWSSGSMDNSGIGWIVEMEGQGKFTFRAYADSPDKPIRVKVEFERK